MSPLLVAVKSNAGAIVAVWAPIIVVSNSCHNLNSSFRCSTSDTLRRVEPHLNWLIHFIS